MKQEIQLVHIQLVLATMIVLVWLVLATMIVFVWEETKVERIGHTPVQPDDHKTITRTDGESLAQYH